MGIIGYMNRAKAPALALLGMGILLGATTPPVVRAAEPLVASEVQTHLQMSAVSERRKLASGEVIPYPVTENSDREMALGLAMVVPAPLTRVADYLATGQLVSRDTTLSVLAPVTEDSPYALAGARFTSGERGEAESFLEASPGTHFNLSLEEIKTIHAARESAGSAAKDAAVERASEVYRRLLRERLNAYRQGGLAAIVPYAREGGAVRDPAIDLRLAAADAVPLARRGRELHDSLLQYPAEQPPQSASTFYWIKRRVQRRPHLSLLHRMVVPGSGGLIHVERYFYAGHSFNATEILTAAIAHEDGTLVICTARVSTDEITGIGNQLKRTVGRSQMRDDIRARLDTLRAAFAKTRTVESP